MKLKLLTTTAVGLMILLSGNGRAEELPSTVRQTIIKAGTYFAENVAVKGGYVYFCTPDLKERFGEGPASPTEIWVQPPGTPTVGLAMVEGFRATNDARLLEGATAAAEALVYGQLKSGAWTNSVDFNPETARSAYRNGRGRGRNFSTLDDGISQGAMQLLMQVDLAHEFNHREIHDVVQLALDSLLNAQFSTGGFPQGWDEVAVNTDQEPVAASYPDYDWRTEGRIKEYWDLYTLNDGAAGTIADTLVMAYRIYQSERYLNALRKLGDFLILSQMPEPQRGWAQQYNFQMNPVWARKFEPAAIAGRESQDVIRTLMDIYSVTGDDRYLAPIPDALDYLQSCVLDDGQLARYYELRTNRPLYMSRRGQVYSLTYDDSNLPSHYGWKVENHVDDLIRRFEKIGRGRVSSEKKPPAEADVRRIIEALEAPGQWISTYKGERLIGQQKFREGDRYLSSEVFSDNLTLLSQYLRSR